MNMTVATIPPALAELGAKWVERDGYRLLEFPAEMKQKANVLLPVDEIVTSSEMWSPAIRSVTLDIAKHTYPGQRQGEYALNKQGVYLLARLAGIDIVSTERMPRTGLLPSEIGWTCVAQMRRSDGTFERAADSKVVDLDVEKSIVWEGVKTARANAGKSEAEIANIAKARWLKERPHVDGKAESKAILRTIRHLLQIQSAYTAAEMSKPFVVVTVSFTPDAGDPETKRLLLQAGIGATQSIYGTSNDEPEAPPERVALPPVGTAAGEIPNVEPEEEIPASETEVVPEPEESYPDEPGAEPEPPERQPMPRGVLTAMATTVGFGAHRGSTLGEIFETAPDYLAWLSSTRFEPKSAASAQVKLAASDIAKWIEEQA